MCVVFGGFRIRFLVLFFRGVLGGVVGFFAVRIEGITVVAFCFRVAFSVVFRRGSFFFRIIVISSVFGGLGFRY